MSSRPRIKIQESNSVKLKNRIAFLFVILHFVFVAFSYNSLPDIIPSHFNFAGTVDKSGPKILLWFLPGLSFALYFLIKLVNNSPHSHNYRVKITEENAAYEYAKSVETGSYINALTAIILFMITAAVIITAFNSNSNIGTFLLPIVVLYLILIIRKSFQN